jgi:hypothetical protein
MNQKQFVEALLLGAADGDAANNEPKRDAHNDAELLRDGFATFNLNMIPSRHHRRRKASCSLLRKRGKSSASVPDRYQTSVTLAEASRMVYPVPGYDVIFLPLSRR